MDVFVEFHPSIKFNIKEDNALLENLLDEIRGRDMFKVKLVRVKFGIRISSYS